MALRNLSHLSLDSHGEEIEAELKALETDYAELGRKYNITERLIKMLENSSLGVVERSKKIIEFCERQKLVLEEMICMLEAKKYCF